MRMSSLLQLPMTRTEETSLLEEGSSDSDHGEGVRGRRGKRRRRGEGEREGRREDLIVMKNL